MFEFPDRPRGYTRDEGREAKGWWQWQAKWKHMLPKIIFSQKNTTQGFGYKVFYFRGGKHTVEFVKNCESISKHVVLNYKHGGP